MALIHVVVMRQLSSEFRATVHAIYTMEKEEADQSFILKQMGEVKNELRDCFPECADIEVWVRLIQPGSRIMLK